MRLIKRRREWRAYLGRECIYTRVEKEGEETSFIKKLGGGGDGAKLDGEVG